MPRPERRATRFVRALLPGGVATACEGGFRAVREGRSVTLHTDAVRDLIASGVLEGTGTSCRPTREAAGWLRRQMLDDDAFAAQHRVETVADGVRLNLAESPLARLAVAAAGEARPWLERHHVEAGERVRRLAERARLQPRLTMSYSVAHTAGGASHASDISDLAADARKELAALYGVLPRDCADVVMDVCGLLKGLQQVEAERGWPRRSAKLVLRIGLDRLAEHFGFGALATGAESRKPRRWMEGERPPLFGDD